MSRHGAAFASTDRLACFSSSCAKQRSLRRSSSFCVERGGVFTAKVLEHSGVLRQLCISTPKERVLISSLQAGYLPSSFKKGGADSLLNRHLCPIWAVFSSFFSWAAIQEEIRADSTPLVHCAAQIWVSAFWLVCSLALFPPSLSAHPARYSHEQHIEAVTGLTFYSHFSLGK